MDLSVIEDLVAEGVRDFGLHDSRHEAYPTQLPIPLILA